MRRAAIVAFALLASVLVVAAVPAGAVNAAPELEVASEHTTASDFQGADTLDNMTVEGSGDSAFAAMERPDAALIDDFEDGDTTPESDSWEPWDSYDLQSTDPINGSWSANLSGEAGVTNTYIEQRSEPVSGDWLAQTVRVNDQTGVDDFARVSVGGGASDIAEISFEMDGTLTINGAVQGTWSAGVPYRVRVHNIDYANNEADVTVTNAQTGSVVAAATDTASGDSFSAYDRLTYRLSNDDGSEDVSLTVDDLDESVLHDAVGDGAYVSQPHDAENVEQGWADVELENATATVDWQAWDGSQWTTINSTQYTTSANKTVALSGDYDSWRVSASFTDESGDTRGRLNSEGVLFDARTPAVDNSSASPSGGELLSSESPTLSIDVSDSDFGTAQGDTVSVAFQTKGPGDSSFSIAGSDTRTSNGTASATVSTAIGGEIEWRAVVTDDHGQTTTSDTFTFALPSELHIYNESDTPGLIDDAEVTIRFYADTTSESPLTVTRTTNDGTVDMTGLPVDQSFIATAEADGYVTRRIFIDSLIESQRIYLLNESATRTETIFEIQDYVGDYPEGETVLEIQRAINGSWQTVAGDFFGANNQFPAQLSRNTRHRLIIQNIDTGDSRILGTYTPIASTSERLVVSPVEPLPDPDQEPGIEFEPATEQLPARDDVRVNTSISEGSTPLANYTVNVVHVNESGNTTLTTIEGVNASGETLRATLDLTNRSGQVAVVASVTTGEGTTVTERAVYSLRATYPEAHTLLGGLASLVGLAGASAGSFTAFLAFVITITGTGAVATQVRLSSEMIGLIAVGWVTAFAAIGWVSYDLLFAVLVAWAALSYLGRHY